MEFISKNYIELHYLYCAKSRANLLGLLDAGILCESLANDLAYILATHRTRYETEYMTDGYDVEADLELNKQYWKHYKATLPSGLSQDDLL